MHRRTGKSKSLKVSELTDHVGYHLRMVSNAVSHAFAKKLEGCGVTVAEWVILREMLSANGKTAPSKVAEMTGLTRGAVSKLIERLLEKGFVSRSEAVGDRRFQEVSLTTRAVKLVPRLAEIADDNDRRFFSVLSPAERKSLIDVLSKLAQAHHLITNPIE